MRRTQGLAFAYMQTWEDLMAGDWIKMRTDLLTSPKVVRIASALNADRFRIAGGLLSVWSLFDVHSADGVLHGYTVDALDDLAAWPGFSAAMIGVGWLIESDGNLELPRFDVHNGASAKRRCQDADRKKNVRKTSAFEADKMRTREEKIREEKIEAKSPCHQQADDSFERFWKLYPNKKGKEPARKAWAKLKVTDELFTIIADGLASQIACQAWTKDGGAFIPHPATWINGKRWEDEVNQGTVRPQSASKHHGFDQRDYFEGLTQREDGTYGL